MSSGDARYTDCIVRRWQEFMNVEVSGPSILAVLCRELYLGIAGRQWRTMILYGDGRATRAGKPNFMTGHGTKFGRKHERVSERCFRVGSLRKQLARLVSPTNADALVAINRISKEYLEARRKAFSKLTARLEQGTIASGEHAK